MANVRGQRGMAERTRSHNPIVKVFVPSLGWTEDNNGHYLLVDLPDFKKEEVKLQVDSSGHITVKGDRMASDNKQILRFHHTIPLPPNSDIDNITGKFDGEILYVTVPKKKAIIEDHEKEVSESESEMEHNNAIIPEEEINHNHRETHLGVGRDNEDVHNKEDVKKHDHNDHDHVGGFHLDEKKEMMHSKIDSFRQELIQKWGKECGQLENTIKILKKNKGIVITAVLAFSLGVFVARKFGSSSGRD